MGLGLTAVGFAFHVSGGDPGRASLGRVTMAGGAAFLVSEFLLSLVKAIGQAYAFWLFVALCALGLLWVILAVPEARCRSLEEIEASWREAPARPLR